MDAAGPSQLAGHLVFCTFNAGMRVATPGSPHATLQNGPSGRRLDVKQAPDHALYFSDTTTISRMGSSSRKAEDTILIQRASIAERGRCGAQRRDLQIEIFIDA